MAMFHLLKIRTSIDIFKNEKCKVTFGLEYIYITIMIYYYSPSLKKWSYPGYSAWTQNDPELRLKKIFKNVVSARFLVSFKILWSSKRCLDDK